MLRMDGGHPRKFPHARREKLERAYWQTSPEHFLKLAWMAACAAMTDSTRRMGRHRYAISPGAKRYVLVQNSHVTLIDPSGSRISVSSLAPKLRRNPSTRSREQRQ